MRAKLLFGQEVNNAKTELVMYRGGIKQDWRVCEQKNRVEGVKGVISVLYFSCGKLDVHSLLDILLFHIIFHYKLKL